MSQNSSNQQAVAPRSTRFQWKWILLLPLWVYVGFMGAQFLIAGLSKLLIAVGVPLVAIDQSVFNALYSAVVYALTLAIVIGVPWLVKRRRTTLKTLGAHRLPTWFDIIMTPAGVLVYLVVSATLVALVSQLVPAIDLQQVQETGFSQSAGRFELLIAFITLVVIAPVAEETLFRGYLYGKLKRVAPMWLAMLVVSALFGAVHGQWNVAIDTFALSLVLCGLREVTGGLWAPVLLHMTKNGIAFYLLFINPTLLNTLGV